MRFSILHVYFQVLYNAVRRIKIIVIFVSGIGSRNELSFCLKKPLKIFILKFVKMCYRFTQKVKIDLWTC